MIALPCSHYRGINPTKHSNGSWKLGSMATTEDAAEDNACKDK